MQGKFKGRADASAHPARRGLYWETAVRESARSSSLPALPRTPRPLIRPETPRDIEAVRRVNQLAFGRHDEALLVDALRDGGFARASLVAELAGEDASAYATNADGPGSGIVGHILFSEMAIVTDSGLLPALALAPMAVLPEWQRRGIGSLLVRRGLEECRAAGERIAIVLGHPEFYPRFGFSSELARPLAAPFSGPSWMALELAPGALAGVEGMVRYPPPFGIQ